MLKDIITSEVEIWKDIKNYEDIYQISTYGRVKRIKKGKNTFDGKILKPYCMEGGLQVLLRNGRDNNKKAIIHRLVAQTFIKNTYNKPQVNHIDGNRYNNFYKNLEWNTNSENVKHSHDFLPRLYKSYGENHKNSISVSQYDLFGRLINVYGSVNEADRQLNIPFTNIAKVARGERKSAAGYVWKYEDKDITSHSYFEKGSLNKKYIVNIIYEEEKLSLLR